MLRLRAAVPKAAIHENRHSLAAEYEIGFAENARVPPPARDLVGAEKRDEAKFGVAVSA